MEGFLTNGPVQVALAVGGGAAVVSAVVGVFTVLRGQTFAGHALADISSAGGAAALLFGSFPLGGFLVMAVLGACGMELVTARRLAERDLLTGIVLAAGLGLTALFLHLAATLSGGGGAATSVLFGSMFAIPPDVVTPALAVGALALAAMALLHRPLLLSAIDPDLAAIRGITPRWLGLAHLLMLALAVSLAAMTIGAILSTALLIGPAAAACRVTRRPGTAVALAIAIGLGATWGGIALAYDSYYWTPGRGWPVSVFVVALILLAWLAAGRARRLLPVHRLLRY